MEKKQSRVVALLNEADGYDKRATMAELEGNEAAGFRLRKLALRTRLTMSVVMLVNFVGRKAAMESLRVIMSNLETGIYE